MVTRMDALFLIDRDARQRELSAEERLAQRRPCAEEWLTAIRETSLRLSREALPKSALGQAVTYTLNQWPKLRRSSPRASPPSPRLRNPLPSTPVS